MGAVQHHPTALVALGGFFLFWLGLFSSTVTGCVAASSVSTRRSTPELPTELDPVEVFFLPDPLEEVIDYNLPITTARPYLLQQQISPRIDLRGNVGKAQLQADQIRLVGRPHIPELHQHMPMRILATQHLWNSDRQDPLIRLPKVVAAQRPPVVPLQDVSQNTGHLGQFYRTLVGNGQLVGPGEVTGKPVLIRLSTATRGPSVIVHHIYLTRCQWRCRSDRVEGEVGHPSPSSTPQPLRHPCSTQVL